MTDQQTIAVLGAGAWGTALSVLLARNGHPVWLWGNNPAHLDRLARERVNATALPGIALSPEIEMRADLAKVAQTAIDFLVAVPSHAFRETVTVLQPHINANATVAWATKPVETSARRPRRHSAPT